MNTKEKIIFKILRHHWILELIIILILSVIVFIFAAYYDLLELLNGFLMLYENLELDEYISVSIFLVFALGIFSIRRWHDYFKLSRILTNKNKDLQRALSEIRQLQGIIPICASCKKIRNDDGYWQQVEEYIHDHSDAQFTHGLCPECEKIIYPDLYFNHEKD